MDWKKILDFVKKIILGIAKTIKGLAKWQMEQYEKWFEEIEKEEKKRGR